MYHKLPTINSTSQNELLGSLCQISGHPEEYSIIANGPLKGKSINDAILVGKNKLLGDHVLHEFGFSFPIIIKFLDCRINLPVAVHPTDNQAKKLNMPDSGKSEASYIVQAEPHACFYSGHKHGEDKASLLKAAEMGQTLKHLKKVPSKQEDLFLIPSQRIHAIGAGNLICEIQRNSYSVIPLDYLDWPVGEKKRKTDRENCLEAMLLDNGDSDKISPLSVKHESYYEDFYCITPHFTITRIRPIKECAFPEDHHSFHLLTCVEGQANVNIGGRAEKIDSLETILIPAYSGGYRVTPLAGCKLLKTFIPDISSPVKILKNHNFSDEQIINLGGYGKHNLLTTLLEGV